LPGWLDAGDRSSFRGAIFGKNIHRQMGRSGFISGCNWDREMARSLRISGAIFGKNIHRQMERSGEFWDGDNIRNPVFRKNRVSGGC